MTAAKTDREMLRLVLRDTGAQVWSDEELDGFLADALRQYSADTGAFRSQEEFLVDSDGVGLLPEGFVSYVGGWNANGDFVPEEAEWTAFNQYGPDWRQVKGLPEMIVRETDGHYRLVPNPHDLIDEQAVEDDTTVGSYPYGVMFLFETQEFPPQDISNDIYGVCVDGEYGVGNTASVLTSAGNFAFAREARREEIRDYAALVFFAAYKAYTADNDFNNPQMADAMRGQYSQRISSLVQARNRRIGHRAAPSFF